MPKKGLNLYHRKDGRWEGTYYHDINPKTGRRKKLSRYGHTEKEAKEKLLIAISELRSGTYIEKKQAHPRRMASSMARSLCKT